jgi:hypothetical protein
MNTIRTWQNHVGTFAAHPITGSHHGPYRDAREAELAIATLIAEDAECHRHERTLTETESPHPSR